MVSPALLPCDTPAEDHVSEFDVSIVALAVLDSRKGSVLPFFYIYIGFLLPKKSLGPAVLQTWGGYMGHWNWNRI